MPAGCRRAQSRVRAFPMLAAGVLVAVLLLPALTPTAVGAMVTDHGDLPGARVGAAAVSVGDGVTYIFGGRTDDYAFSDAIIRFDATTGASEVVARLPESASGSAGRQAAAAVYTGGKAYIFGGAVITEVKMEGRTHNVPQSSADIIEFDPETHTARRLQADRLPEAVWGATAEWVNGVAYVYGGLKFDVTAPDDIGQRDTIVKFDPSAPEGQRVTKVRPGLPYPVQDLASTIVDGNVWLFGGLAKNSTRHPCPYTTDGNSTYRPDVCASDKVLWMHAGSERMRIADAVLPEGRQFAAAASVDGLAYVFGGRTQSGSAVSGILRVDVDAGTVDTMFPQLPGGRYGMPATVTDQDVHLFGGRDSGEHKAGVADVLRFHAGVTTPLAPRNLDVRPYVDEERVRLDWEAPHYDGGAPVTEYRVYRAPVEETADGRELVGDATLVGTTGGAPTFTDETARPGATYLYRVVAANEVGESPTAAEAKVKVAPRAPDAPEDARAFSGDGYALLRWSPPADDGGAEVTQYRVYKGNQSRPVAFVSPGDLEYRDDDVTNNRTYTYRVSAENSRGEGAHTAPLAATPLDVPNPPQEVDAEETRDGVRLSWTPDARDAAGWHVYKGTTRGDMARITDEPLAPSARAFTDPDVARGDTYRYTVAGIAETGDEGPWSRARVVKLIEPPSAPRNVLLEEGPGYVNLTWVPPEDIGGADAVTYVVTREGPEGTRVIASELDDPRYRDRTAYPGVTYRYAVKAYNGLMSPASPLVEGGPGDRNDAPPVTRVTTIGDTRVDVGAAVTLDASGSRDPDGRIVRWIFDFGDGSPPLVSSSPEATHVFDEEDTFVVRVTAEDDDGLKSERAATVTIDVGRAGMDAGNGLPDAPGGDTETKAEAPPGSDTGGFPLPAPGLAGLLAAAGVALAARRRR